jgi:predicted nucleic acid-binding protein
MTVLVDSNVILDVLTANSRWADWSSNALAEASDHGRVVINQVIFAEVSARYDTIEELDAALSPSQFVREQIPFEAAFLAGKAFLLYRSRGGQRRSPIADFYIGAHASIAGYRLLTRDATRYRSYFPRLPLITPDA